MCTGLVDLAGVHVVQPKNVISTLIFHGERPLFIQGRFISFVLQPLLSTSSGTVTSIDLRRHSETISDPSLKELATILPTVMLSSFAPSTLDKYRRSWEHWVNWATEHPEVGSIIPSDPFFVALYFTHLLNTRGTVGAVTSASTAIAWAHHISGYRSPTEEAFVQMTLKGCQRLLGQPIRKSEAMTSPVIKQLVDEYKTQDSPLSDSRFLLIALLCYAGFLRIDELLTTKLSSVNVTSTHMTILLPKCKNDQLRQGHIVYISRLDSSKYCPVRHTEEFLIQAELVLDSDDDAHLLPRMLSTKRGLRAHKTLGISYSTARDVFNRYVRKVFGTEIRYTLHGLRAGGASEAASNGVDGRSISKHGRWKTQKARNGYICDSLENRLKISKNLGL
jgi:integrase